MVYLIFSTRNGRATLQRTLEHFARLQRPTWLQIVAVDNGSSDGSGELLQAWTDRLPMQVLHFARPGKNRALNHALDTLGARLALAELVVFSDDDVLPSPDWLLRLQAAAREHPEADLFGGPIRPDWPCEPPSWLMRMTDSFPILFATTTHGHGPCAATDIYGPNMAVRAHLLARGARFEGAIGPDGSARFGMGSESEFLRRMERLGHAAFFCGDAVVGHQVKPAQLDPAAVVARATRYGHGLAMMDAQTRNRLALALPALRRLVDRELKALAARLPPWAERRVKTRFQRDVHRAYLRALWAAPALPPVVAPAQPAVVAPRPAPAALRPAPALHGAVPIVPARMAAPPR